jgi:hypothetical protein
VADYRSRKRRPLSAGNMEIQIRGTDITGGVERGFSPV